jgi:hypothetical protein
MIINWFSCPADMDALNTEIQARNITPEMLASILLVDEPNTSGIGGTVVKFRVLYWDPKGS